MEQLRNGPNRCRWSGKAAECRFQEAKIPKPTLLRDRSMKRGFGWFDVTVEASPTFAFHVVLDAVQMAVWTVMLLSLGGKLWLCYLLYEKTPRSPWLLLFPRATGLGTEKLLC